MKRTGAHIPTVIDFLSGLNSWSELDRGMVEIQTAFNDLLDRFPEARADFRTLGGLLGAFDDALEAARYHQKQFLSRLHLVKTAHAIRREQGEVTAWTNLADRPLVSEFEAYILRLRASLDALARLLSYLLGWGTRHRFGQFCKRLATATAHDPREVALLSVVSENNDILERYRAIRDTIAHEGRSGSVDGAAPQAEAHEYPRIHGQEAADFVFDSWRSFRKLLVGFATSLRTAV
jgi:hypothetical protein